jgi:hypothetical protein
MVLILTPPSDGFSYYFVPFLLFPKKREMILEQMKVFKKHKRDGFGNELLPENQKEVKNQNHAKKHPLELV